MTTPAAERAGRAACLVLVLTAGVVFTLGLDRPGFFDYEGRYADVGQAMLASGDWVTPRLDGTLFLNKPPLLYWLAAAAFRGLGETEWARLVSVLAAMAAVAATYAIGTRRADRPTGLVAGAFLATMLGFANEARKLRPDMVLTATIAVAVLAWLAADDARGGGRRRVALAAMWAALGIGVLAKGLVAIVIAALPIGVDLWHRHGAAGVRRLAPALGAVVLGVVVLPWHVLVSLRHPGFAWDYVVNQHLLFFLDRKFPRDSEGIGLATFWGALIGRASPWVLLVPLATWDPMLVAWGAGTLLFFSVAPSRLEHYVLPALPAMALLAALGWRRLAGATASRLAWAWVVGTGLGLVALGVVVITRIPAVLAGARFTAEARGILPLVPPAGALIVVTGLAVLLAAWRRAPRAFAIVLGTCALVLHVIILDVERELEPQISWKPVAELVLRHVDDDTVVVFEAPEEYQLVAGLAFYTRRRIELLEPEGFVPPTYLAGGASRLFLPRARFASRWRSGAPTIFVSDLQRWRDTPDGLVPSPVEVLGRRGWRWVLTNRATAYAGARP